MALTKEDLKAIQRIVSKEVKPVTQRLSKMEVRLDKVDTRLNKIDENLGKINVWVATENSFIVKPIKPSNKEAARA